MGTKKEPTEVRREQIVRAAIDIIGSDGIHGFTTARVARRVGISEASLYRHFKNKDAILGALIDDIEETLIGNLGEIKDERVPAIKKMERIFKLQAAYIQENPGIPRIVFSSETLFMRGLHKKLLSFVNRYLKMLGGVLEEGVRDGSISANINPDVMSSMFVGMIQFNALRWLLGGFKYSFAEKGERLWLTYKKNIEAKKGA